MYKILLIYSILHSTLYTFGGGIYYTPHRKSHFHLLVLKSLHWDFCISPEYVVGLNQGKQIKLVISFKRALKILHSAYMPSSPSAKNSFLWIFYKKLKTLKYLIQIVYFLLLLLGLESILLAKNMCLFVYAKQWSTMLLMLKVNIIFTLWF